MFLEMEKEMKTVQETLKNIDEKSLIDNYLETYPVSLDDFEDEVTIGDARRYSQYRLHTYLSRLKEMKITKSSNQGIFFIQRKMEDGLGIGTDFNLVFVDDLKKKGLDANSYAYEFSPQTEIMGWWIADNQLTQRYLLDLLVDIMEEASFFGYEQENLKKELDTITTQIDEIKENPGKLVSFDKVREEFDFDKLNSKEDDLSNAALNAELIYREYSRKKELKEIIDKLGINY